MLDKDPDKNGACKVIWADEDDAQGGMEHQRQSMANFLGKTKRQKAERYSLLHDAHLEAVEIW